VRARIFKELVGAKDGAGHTRVHASVAERDQNTRSSGGGQIYTRDSFINYLLL